MPKTYHFWDIANQTRKITTFLASIVQMSKFRIMTTAPVFKHNCTVGRKRSRKSKEMMLCNLIANINSQSENKTIERYYIFCNIYPEPKTLCKVYCTLSNPCHDTFKMKLPHGRNFDQKALLHLWHELLHKVCLL